MCSRVLERPHVLPCQHAYCEDCLTNLARCTWPTSHCITCKVPFARRDPVPSPILQGVVRSFAAIMAAPPPPNVPLQAPGSAAVAAAEAAPRRWSSHSRRLEPQRSWPPSRRTLRHDPDRMLCVRPLGEGHLLLGGRAVCRVGSIVVEVPCLNAKNALPPALASQYRIE